MKLEIPTPIPTDRKFEAYLRILSCIPPFNTLRPRELEVLAELYTINHENRAIPESMRNRIVFHKDSRKRIADKVGITVQSVYNITLSLRDKKILGNDTFIKPLPIIESITFNFIEE